MLHSLSTEKLTSIVNIQIGQLARRLAARRLELVRQPHPVMSRFCRCSQLKHHDRCLCAWGDKKRCQWHLNSDHVLLDYRWRSHIAAAVLDVTDAAKERLPLGGFDPLYGACPLRRLVQSAIGDQLARELIAGDISDGDTVLVDFDDSTAASTEALTVTRA